MPGESLFAVLANVGQLDPVFDLFAGPHLFVESDQAAVQCVVAVVLRNVIGLAIERECAAREAVGVTANNGTHVGLVAGGDVAVEAVETLNDIGHLAFAVRRLERHYDAAVGQNFDRDFSVLQGIKIDRFAIDLARRDF